MQRRLSPYDPQHHKQGVTIVHKHGTALLWDPWYNKGTAFPEVERERLGLRGLLPPRVVSVKTQEERFMAQYLHGSDMIPPEEVAAGSVTNQMAAKWLQLQQLQTRNETLFYNVLIKHFVDMCQVVYTPTVGWACSNWHKLYRRPRGMFFSAQDKGQMAAMVHNWPQDDVQAIVVTDGSRILGLGDLGINGLGIPVGKLDLYVAAAGFHPSKVLPCVIDVGTDNTALRRDPLYCGLDQPRLTGKAYYDVVDEFVHAVMGRWPHAVLQFEDFQMQHALTLLERYREHHLIFNDDVQGTAATAVAGLWGAMRALGKPLAALAEQRIVCVGAGSAGMGVVRMIAAAMEKQGKLSPQAAASNFWVLDKDGLITQARPNQLDYVSRFARPEGEAVREGAGLLEVVKTVKPTVLLGLAGAGRLFTQEVLSALAEGCERPIVFPMSNPTSKMECTSEEAVRATQGRCVFASGSPQPSVQLGDTRFKVSQANNMYIFPGLARGAYLGRTGVVTDGMLMTAAETLPALIEQEDVAAGLVYPKLKDIRSISSRIAVEVIKVAAAEGHVGSSEALKALKNGDEELLKWVEEQMFTPAYTSLQYKPVGQE